MKAWPKTTALSKSYRLLQLVICCAILSACNGEAPLLTCHDPCAKANEYRDLFCSCRVPNPPSTGSGGGGTSTPSGSPYLDWSWEDANGCFSNRHYYLLNTSPRRLAVKINWKVPNSLDRRETEYVINGNALRREDGIDIGLEAISPNCFDQDFNISSWREPGHASAEESAIAMLARSSEDLLAAKDRVIAHMGTLTVAAAGKPSGLGAGIPSGPQVQFHYDSKPTYRVSMHEPIDCVSACDQGDPLRCAIRGYPPDQAKLTQVRDRLQAAIPANQTQYELTDIYNIFGIAKAACDRGDVRVVQAKLFNRGQYCSFPTFLRATDVKPSIAIHFPNSVKGQRVEATGAGGSGISFPSGYGSPILLFDAQDLNADFGGNLVNALATKKGVYYQTTAGCVFVGSR